MLRAGCAIALLLLVAGCEVDGGPARAGPSAPGVDTRVLERWADWSVTRGDDLGDPNRPSCGADPESEIWFLAAHDTTGVDQRYACTMPSGHPLLVVAVSSASADRDLCAGGLAQTLGIGGQATIDGKPVPLTVTQIEDPAEPGTVWMCNDLLWGTTPAMTPGKHRIVLKHTGDAIPTATSTVDITAE